MLELRDYPNEGGKLVVDGRNVHQAFASTSTEPDGDSAYTWTPDQLYGFNYPPNNSATTTCPGTAYQRSRTTSNDTWQNFLGVVGRQAGAGVTARRPTPARRSPRRPAAIFAGMAPVHGRRDRGQRPEPERRRHAAPAAEVPARLRNWAERLHRSEPLRQETVEADYDHRRPRRPTAARSSRRVTPSRSASASSRSTRPRATSCVKRASATCCRRRPTRTRADGRRLQVPGRPTARRRPADPVDIEVTALRRARRHQGGRASTPTARWSARPQVVPVPVPLHPPASRSARRSRSPPRPRTRRATSTTSTRRPRRLRDAHVVRRRCRSTRRR